MISGALWNEICRTRIAASIPLTSKVTGTLKYFSTISAKISNPPVDPPAFNTRPIPSPNKNPPKIQINNWSFNKPCK